MAIPSTGQGGRDPQDQSRRAKSKTIRWNQTTYGIHHSIIKSVALGRREGEAGIRQYVSAGLDGTAIVDSDCRALAVNQMSLSMAEVVVYSLVLPPLPVKSNMQNYRRQR